MSEDVVIEALDARTAYRPSSLSAPTDRDAGRTLGRLAGQRRPGLRQVEARLTVEDLLSCLPDRERRILELRYFEELSQDQIAAQRRHLPDARLAAAAAGDSTAGRCRTPRSRDGDVSVVVGSQDLPASWSADVDLAATLVRLDMGEIERQVAAGADRVVVVGPPTGDRAVHPLALQLLDSPRVRVVMAVHVTRTPSRADVARWCLCAERFGTARSDVRLALAGGAVPPVRVRRTVAETVSLLGDAVVSSASLLASELVSNALQHAGDGRFELQLRHGEVRLSVFDPLPRRWPTVRSGEPLADAGRGLGIVDAIADAWGITADQRQKAVWCEVR